MDMTQLLIQLQHLFHGREIVGSRKRPSSNDDTLRATRKVEQVPKIQVVHWQTTSATRGKKLDIFGMTLNTSLTLFLRLFPLCAHSLASNGNSIHREVIPRTESRLWPDVLLVLTSTFVMELQLFQSSACHQQQQILLASNLSAFTDHFQNHIKRETRRAKKHPTMELLLLLVLISASVAVSSPTHDERQSFVTEGLQSPLACASSL